MSSQMLTIAYKGGGGSSFGNFCAYVLCDDPLPQTGRRETGRQFFMHCLSPFLNVGTTFAFFRSEGNLPEYKQFWKIVWSGLYMEMPQGFIMRMLIMSWQWALLGSRFLIILYIYIYIYLLLKRQWYLKCY